MKSFILTLLLIMYCGTQLQAQEPTAVKTQVVHETIHFGYLSYNDVLHSMPEYKNAEQQLKQLREAYEQELKRSEEQFSKAYAEYVEGQQSFPENILLKRQKELQQLMQQAMQFKEEARQLLEENEVAVMQSLRNRLDEAIHEVGMKQNLAFVLNTDLNAYPFINAGIGTDITADVLNKLK